MDETHSKVDRTILNYLIALNQKPTTGKQLHGCILNAIISGLEEDKFFEDFAYTQFADFAAKYYVKWFGDLTKFATATCYFNSDKELFTDFYTRDLVNYHRLIELVNIFVMVRSLGRIHFDMFISKDLADSLE